jgi:hypothetical protein
MPSFVLGFHGCDKAVAEAIFTDTTPHLRASQNEYDWLGHGIYFWENSPERAMAWATSQRSRRRAAHKINEPAVIGAVIDLGHCLNLLDSKYGQIIKSGYSDLSASLLNAGKSMPTNRKPPNSDEILLRALDCAVVNTIHARRKEDRLQPFDSVRAAFIEGKPIYDSGGFFEKTHIQVCVRDTGKIKGYFRPISDAAP